MPKNEKDNPKTLYPQRKVTAGGLSGALATIIVATIESTTHVEMDAVLAMAIVTVVGFVVSYFVPNE